MYGLDRVRAAERSTELLEFMDLQDSADKLVADYSHGMKKKTALAAAVIHGPEILFLDEPFEGVDAVAATTLKRLLQRFISHGGTVFLTSHVLEVVERLCSHIGIIQNGRLVASGSLEELRAGVQIAGHDHSPLTLEEIFLQVVGGVKQDAEVLSWL
jgi:ABC-2 type transport system ATP-binding protein